MDGELDQEEIEKYMGDEEQTLEATIEDLEKEIEQLKEHMSILGKELEERNVVIHKLRWTISKMAMDIYKPE